MPFGDNPMRMVSPDQYLYKNCFRVFFNPDRNDSFFVRKRLSDEHDVWFLITSHVCLPNFTRLFWQTNESFLQFSYVKFGIMTVLSESFLVSLKLRIFVMCSNSADSVLL